jgi:alpha-L-rhamnosidase
MGQVIEWFYQGLAGITPDVAGPGFKAIVLRPQPVDGLAWAEATFESIRGRISSRWERRGDRLVLTVAIPANTSATVWVPSRGGSAVLEGGAAAESRPGVTFLRREADRAVYRIESGAYEFASRW